MSDANDLFKLIGVSSAAPDFSQEISAHGLDPKALQVDEFLASITNQRSGVEIVLKDQAMFPPITQKAMSGIWIVDGVHLHGPGHEGFAGYKGLLPLGISFGDTRSAVLEKLGQPEKSGGGNKGPRGIVWPFWDSYALEDGLVASFQYDSAGRVELVTGLKDGLTL